MEAPNALLLQLSLILAEEGVNHFYVCLRESEIIPLLQLKRGIHLNALQHFCNCVRSMRRVTDDEVVEPYSRLDKKKVIINELCIEELMTSIEVELHFTTNDKSEIFYTYVVENIIKTMYRGINKFILLSPRSQNACTQGCNSMEYSKEIP